MHGMRNSKMKDANLIDSMLDKAERKAIKQRFENQSRRLARIEMNRLRGQSISQLQDQHI